MYRISIKRSALSASIYIIQLENFSELEFYLVCFLEWSFFKFINSFLNEGEKRRIKIAKTIYTDTNFDSDICYFSFDKNEKIVLVLL